MNECLGRLTQAVWLYEQSAIPLVPSTRPAAGYPDDELEKLMQEHGGPVSIWTETHIL